jgi:outer membrane lipoprotein-sorting protein
MFGFREILVAIMLGGTSSLMLLSHALAADAAVPAAKASEAEKAMKGAKVTYPGAPAAKAPAAESAPQLPALTAAQIVEKHVAARGGAQAWKSVKSMQLSGKGSNAQIVSANGANESDKEIQLPFTADAAKTEASRGDLDGPLIDYAAKGTKVELDGVELVEGQPAYRLKVTPKSGPLKDVWIDGKTFLDIKMDGFLRRMGGRMHPVHVYRRDFRSVQGVMIPFVVETAVDGNTETHTLLVGKAAINPQLDDSLFSNPHA